MKIKISALILTLLLISCANNKQQFIANNCDFPINSPYPGGILSADLRNNDFDINEELRVTGLKYSLCRYSRNNSKILIPIPLDFKKNRIEIKQGDVFLYSEEIIEKEYRESRITISNENYVSPNEELLPRIGKEYELSQKAKNTFSLERLQDWQMIKPVQGIMSSEFGVKRFINDQPRNRHSGMDIAASEGTDVIAPLSGEIIIAENFFYKGNVIYLNHGAGLVSSYSHLSKINVKNGDIVEKGDLIGYVGKTGRVTGPHLHWEVYLLGIAINPDVFLNPAI